MKLSYFLHEGISDLKQSPQKFFDLLHDKYPVFCKKYDIPTKAKVLGRGSYGITIDIDSDKVLKLTTDKLEAKTSSFLMNKKLKHTWKIYFVGELKTEGSKTYYIIIGEKLQKMSSSEKEIFDDIQSSVFINGSNSYDGEFDGNYNDFYDKFIKDWNDRWGIKTSTIMKMEKYIKWEWHALKELHDNHVDWGDHHSGNILKSGSQWKFIDLGTGNSPAGQIASIKEGKK